MARSALAYKPVPEPKEDQQLKRLLDEIYLRDPCLGTRRLVTLLERDYGLKVNRKRLRRLRTEMGQEAIWCRPKTSKPNETHRKYPYLLRHLKVTAPDQVWCADITYIPMPQGHAYLCAVMDWDSRYVLGWAVSNTMDAALCQKALGQALVNGKCPPCIMNTDQGSQFTAHEWIEQLTENEIRISMDGKGRWMDNVFIERLWRSVKYEEIYLHEHSTVSGLEAALEQWFARYNTWRPHQALDNQTPEYVYQNSPRMALCPEVPEMLKKAA